MIVSFTLPIKKSLWLFTWEELHTLLLWYPGSTNSMIFKPAAEIEDRDHLRIFTFLLASNTNFHIFVRFHWNTIHHFNHQPVILLDYKSRLKNMKVYKMKNSNGQWLTLKLRWGTAYNSNDLKSTWRNEGAEKDGCIMSLVIYGAHKLFTKRRVLDKSISLDVQITYFCVVLE